MNKSLDNTGIMESWSLFLCSKKSLADSSRCKQAPFFFCPTSRETGRLPRTSKTLEIWHRFASLSWRACPGTKRKPSKQWMMMVDLAAMSFGKCRRSAWKSLWTWARKPGCQPNAQFPTDKIGPVPHLARWSLLPAALLHRMCSLHSADSAHSTLQSVLSRPVVYTP